MFSNLSDTIKKKNFTVTRDLFQDGPYVAESECTDRVYS